MKAKTHAVTAFLLLLTAACSTTIKTTVYTRTHTAYTTVDFLKLSGLDANALAPQVVCADPARNRIFAACANSSAIAIIHDAPARTEPGRTAPGIGSEVITVPVGSRMPRRLRNAGMLVSTESGRLYLLGQEQLLIIDPEDLSVRTIDLPGDYEAIALDENRQRAYLAGRTCPDLAIVDAETEQVVIVPCMEAAPPLPFMAASAPPPIRFPFVMPGRKRAYVLDGCTASLIFIDLDTLAVTRTRKLPVEAVPRWHMAGFNSADGTIYAVLENQKREAVHAMTIDLLGDSDVVVDLIEKYTEPAGVTCDPERGEIYIPYDNKALIHVVSFESEPAVAEIALPDLGVDATAYDPATRTLYCAGWKQAALYVADMEKRECALTVPFFPVYPHMNSMALNPLTKKLYVPTGSAAVNGTFGAALSVFDPNTLEHSELRTGWAPVCLARKPGTENFYVFSTERDFAEVTPDGSVTYHRLPHPYPRQAITDVEGKGVWVAYGPHSSWWPNYYISGTRNGIFLINAKGRVVRDRMTPKLAQGMIQEPNGQLWALQNTWGNEAPFLLTYPDDDHGNPLGWVDLRLPPKVENECPLRLLARNRTTGTIYAGKTGDLNTDNGTVYAVDPTTRTLTGTFETGRTPTSLCVDPGRNRIYVTNFDDDSVTIIHGETGSTETVPVGKRPIASALNENTGEVFIVNHGEPGLTLLRPVMNSPGKTGKVMLPEGARPDNLIVDPVSGHAFVTAHSADEARLYRVNPETGEATTLFQEPYAYGEVNFDHANAAFQLRGQWGDGIFRITDMAFDDQGRLWITDYLSGRMWIVASAFARDVP
ncbi:MAG: YncE family protein [Planctomycetota bacterium]